MTEVKKNTIIMTRGDTVVLSIEITDIDGSPYVPAEGDTLRFAMKKNYTDVEPVLVKSIPIDTMELVLEPADTKNLGFGQVNGHYKYDVELTTSEGSVNTVIPRGDIIILEEVL